MIPEKSGETFRGIHPKKKSGGGEEKNKRSHGHNGHMYVGLYLKSKIDAIDACYSFLMNVTN
jgi:hypothetical protein